MHERSEMSQLEPLVGRWRLDASLDGVSAGDVVFEWMTGGEFLEQRWEAPDPVPNGLAIIGRDPDGPGFLQHYFDSRGVARLYRMSFDGKTWKLWRDEEDFSPLDFRQRFEGTFSADNSTIDGYWDACHDGTTWERDFELTYERID